MMKGFLIFFLLLLVGIAYGGRVYQLQILQNSLQAYHQAFFPSYAPPFIEDWLRGTEVLNLHTGQKAKAQRAKRSGDAGPFLNPLLEWRMVPGKRDGSKAGQRLWQESEKYLQAYGGPSQGLSLQMDLGLRKWMQELGGAWAQKAVDGRH